LQANQKDPVTDRRMLKQLIKSIILLLCLVPINLNGQTLPDSESSPSYYRMFEGYYTVNDSTTALDSWVEEGMNMLFLPFRDSVVISIDIGGREKVFFMGVATRMENPGLETLTKKAEFYHWTFISHIKEGIRNAYISREYVEGSFEKYGIKQYFIQILFADQTQFLFYAIELKPREPAPK
jgi:hypothetical protein